MHIERGGDGWSTVGRGRKGYWRNGVVKSHKPRPLEDAGHATVASLTRVSFPTPTSAARFDDAPLASPRHPDGSTPPYWRFATGYEEPPGSLLYVSPLPLCVLARNTLFSTWHPAAEGGWQLHSPKLTLRALGSVNCDCITKSPSFRGEFVFNLRSSWIILLIFFLFFFLI